MLDMNDMLKRNPFQSAQHDLETRGSNEDYTDGSNYYYV